MEEQNEILTVVKEGFARVNQQFERVDQQFERIDRRFEQIDQQFRSLRTEFAEQLDGISDALHAEVQAHGAKVVQRVESVRALIEKVDSKLGLVGENTANVMTEIRRYHTNVEIPLEQRVEKLEGRVWTLEQKK
jgi:archaellum component FlaC